MRTMTGVAIWVFLIDQFIKYVVLYHVFGLPGSLIGSDVDALPYPARVDVFEPFLVLTMAWNRGVNFGLFAGYDLRWILIVVAFAICGFVIWWLRRDPPGRWGMISAGLLIGGALGNVIDRVLYGAVADFLNMSCCGINNPFAFNVADISIFAGAIGLVLFTDGDDKKKTA
ncbi:putative signal peptidase II [Octadecabacter antarcticus 307]|uniref:Lipoprotein signal peptidase n=1 Tax=Octadecabacter antarcticus 307 TaxID=391626 RepID=M9RJI0_9RHOB|nr:signal peptidase II [Octadecabacter antarcticus]AGI69960.1 putative signal peptidase II [Octadecabacter antarcticus 307]